MSLSFSGDIPENVESLGSLSLPRNQVTRFRMSSASFNSNLDQHFSSNCAGLLFPGVNVEGILLIWVVSLLVRTTESNWIGKTCAWKAKPCPWLEGLMLYKRVMQIHDTYLTIDMQNLINANTAQNILVSVHSFSIPRILKEGWLICSLSARLHRWRRQHGFGWLHQPEVDGHNPF